MGYGARKKKKEKKAKREAEEAPEEPDTAKKDRSYASAWEIAKKAAFGPRAMRTQKDGPVSRRARQAMTRLYKGV